MAAALQAVILAAGRGTRLGGHARPKCLEEIGGRALIERYLDVLDGLGIPTIVVVGHGAHQVGARIGARARVPVLATNTAYADGSILSLATGLHAALRDGPTDLLTLDGDVAFAPELLERLVRAPAPDALLVDVGTRFTDEQYMAGLDGDRVVALRRGPADECAAQGEWVGFAKWSASSTTLLDEAVLTAIAGGQVAGGYEDTLARLLPQVPVACVPTGGAPWVEIDFPADLARARALFAADAPAAP